MNCYLLITILLLSYNNIFIYHSANIRRFWDIDTETPLTTLSQHKHWVLCLQFSPNNKFLISGDSQGYLSLYNVHTNEQIGTSSNQAAR